MSIPTLQPAGLHVLVVGSGGREHALAWKLARSPRVARVSVAPGNAGTSDVAETVAIDAMDFEGLAAYCRRERVDLAVVGPADPLINGLVDHLIASGVPAFGPTRRQAILEGSKAFSKAFMKRWGIPTADYDAFDDAAEAHAYLDAHWRPEGMVVKADGLADVQSTLVTDVRAEAHAEIERALRHGRYGDAGQRVLIEQRLIGPEASMLAFVDGCSYRLLQPAQDHKQLHDGGFGPNTEGMGAYAPAPLITPALRERIGREVFEPTLRGLAAEGLSYRGMMFVGVLLTGSGPKVLEYNCRFGDPEAQVTLPGLENDLVDVLEACLQGRLSEVELRFDGLHHLCVVAAAPGYPAGWREGQLIHGLRAAARIQSARVLHAKTRPSPEGPRVAGGRVLSVIASGETIVAAQTAAYQALVPIAFEGGGPQYRRDIGAQATGGVLAKTIAQALPVVHA
jgi:phosphoribosylamine--glycine ligase